MTAPNPIHFPSGNDAGRDQKTTSKTQMKSLFLTLTACLFIAALALRHVHAQSLQNNGQTGSVTNTGERETNYWSRAHPEWPPLPASPSTNLPFRVYLLKNGANILVDDRNFTYPTNMEEIVKSNAIARHRVMPGIKTHIYTTNAAELEAIRRMLPSFEATIRGSSDPSNLPPVLGGTNTSIKPEPLPEKPEKVKPSGAWFFLLAIFRRRNDKCKTLNSQCSMILAFVFSLLFTLPLRADISVSSYLLQGFPLPCPGNEIGHLQLVGGTRTNTSYYPNQIAATFLDPTNFVTTGILHGSPAVLGGVVIPLEGSPFFSIGVTYPSACLFHTNEWPCFEVHFDGAFPNGTNFANTNVMLMDPDSDALVVAYVAEAIFSSPPYRIRPIFSQSSANMGLFVPTATRIGDAVQLDYELPEGFTAQINASPDLQTWTYATNGGGGVNYVTIPNQTNQVMFYSITTTNVYTTAP
jgi:hypothetical protein